MSDGAGLARTYESAARRWEGIGPYYAMFPTQFGDDVVARYTRPGDIVLDPFAGRGTAIFSAAHQGRQGVGVEINPVGWIYAKAKIQPASKEAVIARLRALNEMKGAYAREAESLPLFFEICFARQVREFLAAARGNLDWMNSSVDRTTMALLLVYLHGKRGAALSNQMRQTKSMSPDYAIRWWRERDLTPPEVDPFAFMVKRLEWRYAKGLPKVIPSEVHLADSEVQLAVLRPEMAKRRKRVRLLLTSPPYFALTNYHYDQWLRLWLLGRPPTALRVPDDQGVRGKFENRERYTQLLRGVFEDSARLMATSGIVYVRTGLGLFTHETTLQVLRSVFPRHRLTRVSRPYMRPTQTSLFGDAEKKVGEVDFIMKRS